MLGHVPAHRTAGIGVNMHKLRRRTFAVALVGATAAGITIASTGTASAAAWTDTPLFFRTYAACAQVGQDDVNGGYALNWACSYVKWWDGTTYMYQLREFVE
jgi:hypothetical protein